MSDVTAKKPKKKYNLFTGKALFYLILPIVIESILSASLGMIDSMMISWVDIGENASNAVSNVDSVSNLIIQLFSAFCTGGAIITSHYLGAQDSENANKSAKQMIMLVLVLSTFIGLACIGLNWPLLKLLYGSVAEDTFAYMQTYFYLMAASFPFIGLFNVAASLMRIQRKSTSSMVGAFLSSVLNVGLNALFLFPCNLGTLGVGLSTLICRFLSAVFMLVLLGRKNNLVKVKLFEKFRFDGGMLKRILTLAIPSGIESCLFQLGKLMTSTFINSGCYVTPVLDGNGNYIYEDGILKTVNYQANANSIASSINTMGSIVGSGVGNSCMTVVGQAVGAGDVDQCKYYIKKMLAISLIANAVWTGLIIIISPFFAGLYGFSDEAISIAKSCMYFFLGVQFFVYPFSFTTSSILKATADVKYVMFGAVGSMLIVRVGLCFILVSDILPFGPQLGAWGYWIAMCSDWCVRGILFTSRLISGRWKKAAKLNDKKAEPLPENESGSAA